MPAVSDRNRFNIPILEFLTRRLSERFPDIDFSSGAVRDLVLLPAAAMLQPNRDLLRVISRNVNLRNFQVMLEEELDGLASNFLIARRSGNRARGIQRVFFSVPRAVQIGPGVSFFDSSGLQFIPTNLVSLTQTQLSAQVVDSTGEYYLDVPVIAAREGVEGSVSAGSVTQFQGIPGATRTVNEKAFASGKNADSNTELYVRILEGVANRELVKRPSIQALIKDSFSSVRAVHVVGYGDADMRRDVVGVVMAVESLFPRSFCQKINLPLGIDGEVKFTEDDGTVVTTPVGGFAGAIVDTLGADFSSLEVNLDGRSVTRVAVQPGFKVRLLETEDPIDDVGDFLITRVAEVPIAAGGDPVRAILLNRSFGSVSDVLDDIDRFPYTIVGSVHVDRFHVGGKIDVYVDSTSDVEKSVITTVTTDAAGTAEIFVGSSTVETTEFEDGIGFDSPVISITSVEHLDPVTGVVFRTLTAGLHYVLIRKEQRSLFVDSPSDILIIRGRDSDDIPLFQGARLRISYITNPDYSAIQQFVDDPIRQDITKSVQILPPRVVILDIDLRYRGTIALLEVKQLLSEFISEKSLGAEITVNEIVSTLAFFGVTDIQMPITLTSQYDTGVGVVERNSSQDRLSAGATSLFRAATDLSIERLA